MEIPVETQPLDDMYTDTYDEDDGSKLEPDKVAAGVKRELDFMINSQLGEAIERSAVPAGHRVWSARWCFRRKGDGVRARYVVR